MTETAARPFPKTAAQQRRRPSWQLARMPLGSLSIGRLVRGGRLADLGRLPRYAGLMTAGLVAIWVPIGGYLAQAPLRYTSSLSLILPGSGAQASVNLDQIGQASSAAPSPFSSNSVSPTETYKRLLAADRILSAAGARLNMNRQDFGSPRIELVDQTGLIHAEMIGNSPADAQARAQALLQSFFNELDALRRDEKAQRTGSEAGSIDDYQASVRATRAEVARLQHETGLISAAQYAAMVAQHDQLSAQLEQMSAAFADKSRAVETLESSLGLDARLAAATLKLQADAEYAALVGGLAAASADLSATRAAYGPQHPLRRAAEDRMAATAARVADRARALTGLPPDQLGLIDVTRADERAGLLSSLVTAAAERQGLAAQLAQLQDQVEQSQLRVTRLIAAAARLEDSERNFRVAETVLASAEARSKTAQSDLYASYPLVQVLEDPSLPQDPSSPKRLLAVAAGLAASVFLLIGLALAWIRRPLIDKLLTQPPAAAAP